MAVVNTLDIFHDLELKNLTEQALEGSLTTPERKEEWSAYRIKYIGLLEARGLKPGFWTGWKSLPLETLEAEGLLGAGIDAAYVKGG